MKFAHPIEVGLRLIHIFLLCLFVVLFSSSFSHVVSISTIQMLLWSWVGDLYSAIEGSTPTWTACWASTKGSLTYIFYLCLINLHIIIDIKLSVFKLNDTITSKVGQLDHFFEDSIVVTLRLCSPAALYTYTTVHCNLIISILLYVKSKIIYVTAIIVCHILF